MKCERIIDMSQAHLIPERIREYAPRIAEVLEKYPAADKNAQLYYELLCSVEYRLSQEPLDSDFFKKTMATVNENAPAP